jgi:hypothetical protein
MAPTIRTRIDNAAKKLRQHGQDHLLQFIDQLEQAEKSALLSEIEALDLALIDDLIERYVRQEPHLDLPAEILPAPVYLATPTAKQRTLYQQAIERGERLIA